MSQGQVHRLLNCHKGSCVWSIICISHCQLMSQKRVNRPSITLPHSQHPEVGPRYHANTGVGPGFLKGVGGLMVLKKCVLLGNAP
jgi:hypothetical protein